MGTKTKPFLNGEISVVCPILLHFWWKALLRLTYFSILTFCSLRHKRIYTLYLQHAFRYNCKASNSFVRVCNMTLMLSLSANGDLKNYRLSTMLIIPIDLFFCVVKKSNRFFSLLNFLFTFSLLVLKSYNLVIKKLVL